MSTDLTLKNEQLISYLATNDSIRALEKTVDNGQSRLALQVVLEIVSELTERLFALEEKINPVEDEPEEILAASEVVIESQTPAKLESSVKAEKDQSKPDEAVATKSEEIKASK
jgi:hypothetical protein